MAYQFLHIDTVARSVPKKAQSKRWGLSDTLAEAARLDGACPHIDAPKPPKRVYGVPMSIVQTAVESRAVEARDAKGRKLRKDAPVMLAGVVSYPISMANLGGEHWPEYERWERKTLDWLASRFGDGLASVVRHTDETFPHLHFFIVPELGANGGLDLEAHHPGIAAREAAKRAGKDSKESNRAYCDAMRDLQNDFHRQVGLYYGHLREGPRRRRLTRGDYKSEQREATQRAEMMKKIEVDLIELERLRLDAGVSANLRERTKVLDEENKSLKVSLVDLEMKHSESQKAVEALRGQMTTVRKNLTYSSEIILNLLGLILEGQDRFRSFLITAAAPVSIYPAVWEKLKSLLSGRSGGGQKQRSEPLSPSRRRGQDER